MTLRPATDIELVKGAPPFVYPIEKDDSVACIDAKLRHKNISARIISGDGILEKKRAGLLQPFVDPIFLNKAEKDVKKYCTKKPLSTKYTDSLSIDKALTKRSSTSKPTFHRSDIDKIMSRPIPSKPTFHRSNTLNFDKIMSRPIPSKPTFHRSNIDSFMSRPIPSKPTFHRSSAPDVRSFISSRQPKYFSSPSISYQYATGGRLFF